MIGTADLLGSSWITFSRVLQNKARRRKTIQGECGLPEWVHLLMAASSTITHLVTMSECTKINEQRFQHLLESMAQTIKAVLNLKTCTNA